QAGFAEPVYLVAVHDGRGVSCTGQQARDVIGVVAVVEVTVGVLRSPPGDGFGKGVLCGEAEELRHVPGPPGGPGANRPHRAGFAERYLIDPALAGALLPEELAVAVEQQHVRVAGRSNRPENDSRGVVVDVQAGDALPRQRPDAASVPTWDFRIRGGEGL